MISGPLRAKDARGRDIDLRAIDGLLERIVNAWHPEAIWLFGSRARGEATEYSDWDLFVIAPDDTAGLEDPRAAWRVADEARVCADVILCGSSEFADYRDIVNTLAYEASHNGVLIYER